MPRQASPPGGRDYALTHGGRQIRMRPGAFWVGLGLLLAMGVWTTGTAVYFAFREDVLTGLLARKAEMQYAYEDRIAELRAQVDRHTSRQLLDQEQVEQRIEQLLRRQSTLEARTSMLAGFPEDGVTGSVPKRPGQRAAAPAAATPPAGDTVIVRPRPDRHSSLESRAVLARAPATDGREGRNKSLAPRLAVIEQSLDRVESRQGAVLLAMEDSYDTKVKRMRAVLADLGVDAGRTPKAAAPVREGIGGPYIPASFSGNSAPFERQLGRIAAARAQVERLNRTIATVPLRRPVDGDIETSSSFGVRLDPFLRAPAMHSGLDFRATTGERVMATAAGTVITAGWSGGYGRMVEIDHGNGFTTRYAHLSEISVREGQDVRAGHLVGRVGSTGRSTGPHLHYETRNNGEAIDPQKFLRAGLRLADRD